MFDSFFSFVPFADTARATCAIGFIGYTCMFPFARFLVRDPMLLRTLDQAACRFVVFVGIGSLAWWLICLLLSFFLTKTDLLASDTIHSMIRCMAVIGIIWFGVTQLLRIRWIRRSWLVRSVLMLPFIYDCERIIILLSSFHRDFLPAGSAMYCTSSLPLARCFHSTMLFLVGLFCYAMYLRKKHSS